MDETVAVMYPVSIVRAAVIGEISVVDGLVYDAGTTKKDWVNSSTKKVTFTAQWKKNA